jgi:hypothetical protein
MPDVSGAELRAASAVPAKDTRAAPAAELRAVDAVSVVEDTRVVLMGVLL